jgi:hypothetical protein
MNTFKFNSFNGASQQGFTSSSAKAKPPAAPTFQLDAQADFPELMQSTTLPSTNITTNSYMKAIRTTNSTNSAADPNDDVPNGWVKYTYSHNTKSMSVFDSTISRNVQRFNKKEENLAKNRDQDEDQDYALFTKLINKLEHNWIRYADNYVEIYGQDYYDHFHLMPNYQWYPDSEAGSDVDSDYDSTSSVNL